MHSFLALTSPGVEILLAEELKELGADQIVQKPEGVYFEVSLTKAYQIGLATRFATRIMLKLGEGEARNKDELYQSARAIDWLSHFDSGHTFAIDFVGKSQEIRNSQFGGLTVKDAIVDSFRDNGKERPSVDKTNPHIGFQVRLLKQQVTFYLDFSGRGLFQRGYRENKGAAPLKEHLAAAIVKRSGWLADTSIPLVDPMCGSGTVLIEACYMAAGYLPGIDRQYWGFEHWYGHQQQEFEQQLEQAKQSSYQGLSKLDVNLFGHDIDANVLSKARQNIKRADLAKFINLSEQNINQLENHYGDKGVMLFNPPYGERIGELPELVENFVGLGQTLKASFQQWQVVILTANIDLLAMLKLASKKRYKFKNGPLDCQLALYTIDDKQIEKDQNQPQFAIEDSSFANRLKKNVKNLKSWLKSQAIECYRVYDADIPEYNVAIDVYGDYLVIQEYAAPATIDEQKVAKRLQEIIYFAPKVLNVDVNKVVLKTRSKQKGNAQYQKIDKSKRFITVHEHGAKLKVNLWDYLDTGLFLDHRKTRQIVAKKAKNKTLLNLFAYTGSVSLQAALHGASKVTTVDMSNTYLNWGQENFALNNLGGHKYPFIQADCLKWLKECKEQYDVIFIDPPTFSNSKRMDDSFDVQRDHVELITDALKCLAPHGEIIFTNNKRNFKIDRDAMCAIGVNVTELTEQTRDKDFLRNKHIHNSWLIKRES
ncbi:bifunctional 23S rRNA (guanine(2069)-N(7))-methyltransferase RlmK/23S rRNA (guanine(2445)-N(2))-methyltransferase RlmL [Thalassotalea ganghwensis]